MGYFAFWVLSGMVWNHCPHWVHSWTHHASQKHSRAYFITIRGQDLTYTSAACLPNTPRLILCWAQVLSLISAELVKGCTMRLLNDSLIHATHACDKAERVHHKEHSSGSSQLGKGIPMQCSLLTNRTHRLRMWLSRKALHSAQHYHRHCDGDRSPQGLGNASTCDVANCYRSQTVSFLQTLLQSYKMT